MLRLNGLVFLAVLAWPATLATGADKLTLEQALALAVDGNRTLRATALEADKARDKLNQTRTRQFPSLSLYLLGAQQLRSFNFTLQQGVLGTYPGTGPLPAEDVHLKTPLQPTGLLIGRVSQPLTTLVRIRRNMDTLKTGIEIAGEQTRAEKQKMIRDVKKLYYSLQQVESALRSVQETTKLYEEVEKLTSNYVAREVALKGDLLQSQTQVARSRQTEVSLVNQQASAKEQLNRLLGRDLLTEFDVEPALEATGDEPDLAEARARALRDRPELRQARLKQKQAAQDLQAKKAESIPDLSAEFNNLTFLNYGRFFPTQSTSLGVSLSWEPFDWGRKKHEAAEKQHTVDQARLSEQETAAAIIADINDKFRQLRYQRAELQVARLAHETALENLRVVKNRYQVQAALVKDVLQSQAGVQQSSAGYQQALASFWNARAEFERALGEDR